MTILPSLAGFAAELRDLPIGGMTSKIARVPVGDRDGLKRWYSGVRVAVSKAPGTLVTQKIDAIDERFDHALRIIIVVRAAA